MAWKSDKTVREMSAIRDTIESIWVAIILAFVLRAFMFEAFVIPTGSMAPRLVGEHWDLRCPSCGWDYRYGLDRREHGMPSRKRRVLPVGARCPNDGYPFDADPSRLRYLNGGDRVLVLKYPYAFRSPRPFDVVVFRNPQNNQENYIKRLVGLPGEAIEIVHGDVFVRKGADYNGDGTVDRRDFAHPRAADESPWHIRRKVRPEIRDALWHVVYDNDYRPDAELIERYNRRHGPESSLRPPRWEGDDTWDLTAENGRRFEFRGGGAGRVFLQADRRVFGVRYGYNAPDAERDKASARRAEVCHDLRLSLTFRPRDSASRLALALSGMYVPQTAEQRQRFEQASAVREQVFEAEIDVAKRRIALRRRVGPELPDSMWQPIATCTIEPLKPGRGYEVALSHVDYEVTVWFEGRPVIRTDERQYTTPLPAMVKGHLARMEKDLSNAPTRLVDSICRKWVPTPRVSMTASGGACSLTHVRLYRDVYYTVQNQSQPSKGDAAVLMRYKRQLEAHGYLEANGQVGWGVRGNPIYLHDRSNDELDEFYMLGDNSPQSLDSRAWTAAAPTLKLWRKSGHFLPRYEAGAEPIYTLGTVPRYNLIGRAMFVYWPSGYRIPGLPGLPVIPNVGKMRLVR
ncbi:MAG: signal peptidase I [Phycisphaerae bacterium]|nr:signal peptidase I [Phycisphaerae bacterium]